MVNRVQLAKAHRRTQVEAGLTHRCRLGGPPNATSKSPVLVPSAMALDKSALSELLDALRAGGDLEVVREALGLVLQALIEAEAAQQIGAGRYERSATRTTHRNGSRTRLLSTKAGDVELKIPKLREGSFFPSLLEPRRRIDRALLAVVMEAYVHGTSTRKVDNLVKAMGVGDRAGGRPDGQAPSHVRRPYGQLARRPPPHRRWPRWADHRRTSRAREETSMASTACPGLGRRRRRPGHCPHGRHRRRPRWGSKHQG